MLYVTWIKNCFIKKHCICWLGEGGAWNSFYICKRTLLDLSGICFKKIIFKKLMLEYRVERRGINSILYSILLFAFPISDTKIWFCHNFLPTRENMILNTCFLNFYAVHTHTHVHAYTCMCVSITWPVPCCSWSSSSVGCGEWRESPWLPSQPVP